jgi:acyl-CoA thioester hydrolase
MPQPTPHRRADYPHLQPVQTRWMDNDVYGHLNNVVYYSYFDSVINRWLIEQGGLDVQRGDRIGLCVESRCSYLRPLAYPEPLEAGLRVAHLGRSSVRYQIAIFAAGSDEAAAQGEFVHVFVDRATRRAAEMPPRIRAALERLLVAG